MISLLDHFGIFIVWKSERLSNSVIGCETITIFNVIIYFLFFLIASIIATSLNVKSL